MRAECTPEQKARCPLKTHFVDRHHEYFPKREYSQPLEKTFRNLGENIVELCRHEHNEVHANEEPPYKPSMQYMAEAVLRSEVHLTNKTARQVDQVMRQQQQVINQFWRTAEERRA